MPKNKEKGFKIKFDKNTIDHLGIKLYSTFPPVIAELVSNAYDADSLSVEIIINYAEKSVEIVDKGHGMSHDEINDAFLRIGRNRREATGTGKTKSKKREVMGKKGLGKLAVFGVANTITVTSVCDNYKNSLRINYTEMKATPQEQYAPTALTEYEETEDKNGTYVRIEDITLGNLTSVNSLGINLAKRFNFFDTDFEVKIVSNEGEELIVEKQLYIDTLEKQYEWIFPQDFSELIEKNETVKFLEEKGVNGTVMTTTTPLSKKETGFNIYARKKIAAQSIFFNDRSNDNFYSYVTGQFNVDIIDEDMSKDLIGTARQSVLWEQDVTTKKLEKGLDALVRYIGQEWRKKRAEDKEEGVNEIIPENFYDGMDKLEKENIKRIKKSLINNSIEGTDYAPIVEVLETVKSLYELQSFREYLAELAEEQLTVENMEKIADDWEWIEAKEMSKIALGRIEAINKFENFIKEDAGEVKVIQPFLEKFPWILDPRITTFQRELTFKKILKENFIDDELEEKNRRLDFLCNLVNGELVIIELKRPSIKISDKEIKQALKYRDFILKNHKEAIAKGVKTILMSDRYDLTEDAKLTYPSLEVDGKLYIKSYSDILMQAKQYNREYINTYEQLKEKKNFNRT